MKNFYKIFLTEISIVIFVNVNGQNPNYTGFRPLTQQEYTVIPQAPSYNQGGNALPSSCDLSNFLPPPGAQGQQGSCTSWAVAYAVKSYEELKEENWSYYYSNGVLNENHVFSPAFIHNQITHYTNQSGVSFVEALNFVKNNGCATLSEMPYNERDNTSQPSQTIKNKARRYKIKGYYKLGTFRNISVEDVKYRLSQNYPVMFACYIDEGFNKNCSSPNIWYGYCGRTIGSAHAMVVVGYDDKYQAFKVLNSYGINWGHKGYCWIAYNHFKDIAIEAYIAYDESNKIYDDYNGGYTDNAIVRKIDQPIKINPNPSPPIPVYDKNDYYVKPKPFTDVKEYSGSITGGYNITSNTKFTGSITGPLTISNGANLIMTGSITGSVTISGGASLNLTGNITGDLSVYTNSTATVKGCITGKNISYGGSSNINCSGSNNNTNVIINSNVEVIINGKKY